MLSTKRLVLSKPSIADFALFSEILTCPQQTRFLPNESPYNLVQRENYLRNRINHWEEHGFGTFVISLKDEGYEDALAQVTDEEAELDMLAQAGTKLGFIGVEYTPVGSAVDIRFALTKEHEGFGYTSEAASEILDFIAKNTPHRQIYGVAMPENQASKAVLVKLGMTPALDVKLYEADDLDCFSLVLNLHQ